MLGVDVLDVTDDARDFVREYDLGYPMLRDGEGEVLGDYGVIAYPETFVIDRRGQIVPAAAGPWTRSSCAARWPRCWSRREARRRCSPAALALARACRPRRRPQCPKTTLGDVEDEVMCPVCGTPLGLAQEAPQAERQRALIARLVDDCQSKEQVKARLVAEFGDEVLALPGRRGLRPRRLPGARRSASCSAAARWSAAALGWRRARRGRDDAAARPATGAAAERLQSDLDRYDL